MQESNLFSFSNSVKFLEIDEDLAKNDLVTFLTRLEICFDFAAVDTTFYLRT